MSGLSPWATTLLGTNPAHSPSKPSSGRFSSRVRGTAEKQLQSPERAFSLSAVVTLIKTVELAGAGPGGWDYSPGQTAV